QPVQPLQRREREQYGVLLCRGGLGSVHRPHERLLLRQPGLPGADIDQQPAVRSATAADFGADLRFNGPSHSTRRSGENGDNAENIVLSALPPFSPRLRVEKEPSGKGDVRYFGAAVVRR